MITLEDTIRSYAGRTGCMCGCNGTYNTGVRARKLAITYLTNHPQVKLYIWHDGGAIAVDTGERNRVLYLTDAGIEHAREMGIPESK